MDLDTIDPRSIDVAHTVSKLSFRFYSDREALRLSVCRITSPNAFDELGRSIPRGLYDPALGPTSYKEGPCLTCGLKYNSCPGHFGHVELPVPVLNPLLTKVVLKILKSSCWNCPCLLLSPSDINLLLARLYFEDAGMPKCGYAVEAFRGLRKRYVPRDQTDVAEHTDKESVTGNLVCNWRAFFKGMPRPLSKYLRDVGSNDVELVEKRMLQAARVAWKDAKTAGKLLQHRSQGWKSTMLQVLSGTAGLKCPLCFRKGPVVRKGNKGRLFRKDTQGEILLSPAQIESHCKALWDIHREVFELLFSLKGRDVSDHEDNPDHSRLFVRIVLVPPSRFRPASKVGNMAYAAEHPQNLFFQRMLAEVEVIMTANKYGLDDGKDMGLPTNAEEEDAPVIERPTKARFVQAMSNMQEALRDLYDSSVQGAGGKVQMTGIRQQLESKTGLFRQHMMGKRVNFSCRSVIGPDVFLDTNEVGIPESFAKLLTIPEPVIPMNLANMQRAVLNGPSIHPGATAVEDWTSSGVHRVIMLTSSKNKKRLEAQASLLLQNRLPHDKNLSNGHSNAQSRSGQVTNDMMSSRAGAVPKRVHRHLRNGDIVLFNRQPTLHRVSIMAHKVRVLPDERTIRFHYANCGSYNADFDGDEMNIHVPQDSVARAEAEELLLSSKHYIVPTSGAPVRGLIQDHIAAATLLSHRDTFLERDEFMQLLYAATDKLMGRPHRAAEKYVVPFPAIRKPGPLWTGKQLISTILLVVRDGRPGLSLTANAKTKASIIGSEESEVLFRKGQLLKGIIDKSSLGSSIYGIVHAVQEAYGCDSCNDFLSAMSRVCVFFMRTHGHSTGVEDLLLRENGERERRKILSENMEKVGINVTNAVYKEMSKESMKNHFLAKSLSDARILVEKMIQRDGPEAEDRLDTAMKSALNKVSSSVMKKCVPAALKKTFPKNGFALMTNTGAKGSAVNSAQISCLLGSTVLEGKRVPRMGGSGATLPCFAPFDAAPNAGGFISGRFLTGISPQEFFFHAMSGREGLLDTSLKTANSGYLQRCLIKHMEGVSLRYDYTVRDSDNSVVQFVYGDDGIDPSKSRWLNEKMQWQVENEQCLKVKNNTETGDSRNGTAHRKSTVPESDTRLELASPGALSKLGAISESYYEAVRKERKKKLKGKSSLQQFLEERYRAAALEPGEAVGVVAAQGVGEPSTQMTLNTFHHAGSSSAHVTLGIPRLRELLMMASKYPKTPSMTLPIMGTNKRACAEKLSRLLQRIALVDLLDNIVVKELGMTVVFGGDMIIRNIEVGLHLPEEDVYRKQLDLDFDSIRMFVARLFLPLFEKQLKSEMRRVVSDSENRVPFAVKTYIRVAEKPDLSGYGMDNGFSTPGESEADDVAEQDIVGKATRPSREESEESDESESESDSDEDDDEDKGEEITRKQVKAIMELHEADEELEEDAGEDSTDGKTKPTKKHRKSKGDAKSKGKRVNGVILDGGHDGNFIGKMGYVPNSFEGVSGKVLRFKWGIPAVLLGKLDAAALAKETASSLMIKEVKRISRCFIEEKSTGCDVVTEGSNIAAILDLGQDLVDFDQLETNDMFGILQRFGVEAMRVALIKEFVKVFDMYGIPVNIRHLGLIADYMTALGGYRGFNRRSMDSTPSPFQRMTFETSINVLTDAAINGTEDSMTNPSAALAVGQLCGGGTGGFQLVQTIK